MVHYERSIRNPQEFWAEVAGQFYWKKHWDETGAYTHTHLTTHTHT